MLFVVANIGSDGLLGTEALQSYLPHQLDLRTGQLWADGLSSLRLHQQRLAPELDGLLTTAVVIPPDSEIVAQLSVSGVRPNGCVLVEPYPSNGLSALPDYLEEIVAGSHPSYLPDFISLQTHVSGAGGTSNRPDYISTT